MKSDHATNSDFCLKEAINRYSAHIAADVRSKKRRKAVAEEYAYHLEDAVYQGMLSGKSERDAFFAACDELGDPTKLQEMLACVHNRDPLPSYVKYLIAAAMISSVAVAYFLIENTIFRAWILLFFQLTLLGFGIFCIYCAYRFLHALRARSGTLKKLRRFCGENGLKMTVFGRGYTGLFHPHNQAQVTIETKTQNYIISIWGTFFGKRHLHLTDIGLYMYAKVIGYANIYTRVHSFFTPGYYLALPKGLTYFSMFHTELTDVPKGMHLLPQVDYEARNHPQKTNVPILLLSPVPFKTSLLISGRQNEALDGDAFLEAKLYSTVGFLSYLRGEEIKHRGSFGVL